MAFLGTPDVAVGPLEALHGAGYEVAVVVTQPDKRRGRGGDLLPSPVKAAADRLGLPVTTRVDDVLAAGVELGVVVAFGRLIKPHVLDAVPMVNVHFSLLPRWRGAAPVERALLAGDDETGVCLMQLEAGLDTGPVLACRAVPIEAEATASHLRQTLAAVGTELLLTQLREGLSPGTPQAGEPTYAAKIEPEELRLDWSQPATALHRVVRVGRAWTTFRGRRLGVLTARLPDPDEGGSDLWGVHPTNPSQAPGELAGPVVGTGAGALELIQVQPEGRAAMSARDWLNGARPRPGERLGG